MMAARGGVGSGGGGVGGLQRAAGGPCGSGRAARTIMLNGLDGSMTCFLKNSRNFATRPHLPWPSNTCCLLDCHLFIALRRSFLLAIFHESEGSTGAASGGRSSPGGNSSSLDGCPLAASGLGATLANLLPGLPNPNFFLRVGSSEDSAGELSMPTGRRTATRADGGGAQIESPVVQGRSLPLRRNSRGML